MLSKQNATRSCYSFVILNNSKATGFMIKKMVFLLTIVFLTSYLMQAQQNLFNIPSGDINAKDKFFYQHQLNLYSPYSLESKSHLVYGLGKNWEIGANIVNTKFDFRAGNQIPFFEVKDIPSHSPVSPLLMLTAQKGFPILPQNLLRVNIGTQVGTNPINNGINQIAFFNYLLLASELPNHTKLTLGTYHTNDFLVGSGSNIGLILGYEIPLNKRWFLMGDMISGNNSNSVAVIGAMYNVSKRVQFCFGGILPMPNNEATPMGIVLELNLLGWDLW